jgi:PII-like signaling protein
MVSLQDGCLLRIFIGESVQKDNIPLYEWLVRRAKHEGLVGATVLRGIEGFGASGKLHHAGIFDFTTDLPVIVEIVDSPAKIEKFIPILDDVMTHGLAMLKYTQIGFYRNESIQNKN